jgi:hypothetical protein
LAGFVILFSLLLSGLPLWAQHSEHDQNSAQEEIVTGHEHHNELPDYRTGEHTGAVIENADFSGAQRLSEDQRYYCCAWGGSKTRATIPGGCEGIPNKLGR